jgi:hypothetical protein
MKESAQQVPNLEGIRGFAALSIFIVHYAGGANAFMALQESCFISRICRMSRRSIPRWPNSQMFGRWANSEVWQSKSSFYLIWPSSYAFRVPVFSTGSRTSLGDSVF